MTATPGDDKNQLRLTFENALPFTDVRITGGTDFTLEVLRNGRWATISPRGSLLGAGTAHTLELVMCPFGELVTQTISLSFWYYPLSSGHYRILKEVHLTRDGELSIITYAAEFDL